MTSDSPIADLIPVDENKPWDMHDLLDSLVDADSFCRLRLITSQVDGVNPDLRVRPFFHPGGTVSIREFVVGALQAEMGLQAVDPDLDAQLGVLADH